MSEKTYKLKIHDQIVFVGESVASKIKSNDFVEFNALFKYENETDSLYKRMIYSPNMKGVEIEETTTEEMMKICSN